MSRFLGGVFGDCRPSTADAPNTTGVYDMKGQYYVKQEGGWLDPISATGGDVTDTSTFPGKSVHIFTGPGNFVVSSGSGLVEVLLVAAEVGPRRPRPHNLDLLLDELRVPREVEVGRAVAPVADVRLI